MNRSMLRLALAGATLPVVLTAFTGRPGGPAGVLQPSAASFTSYPVAGLAPNGGGAVGTQCPGSSACWNLAAEPQIRADNAGRFYASSENGLGGGTEAWASTDGGRHFLTLPSPNAGSNTNNTGFAPGGGDTDIAVAPDKNPNGTYNVYVASLSLANVDVSTSTDGGHTWSLNPVGAMIPGDDREWIAADDSHQSALGLPLEGGQKVCVSYHDIATFNIDVNCSYDAGRTFTQLGDAIDPAHAYLIDNNEIGNLSIARDLVESDKVKGNHFIYQIFSGIASASETVCSTAGTCGYHAVWVGVSTDGGRTFTDYPVYINPNTQVSYGHQFVNLSVDRAGNLYAVYSDNHTVSYSFSTDTGKHWRGPFTINRAPSNTAIMPWSVAGNAGKLDVVWYGTSYYQAGQVPDNYPMSAAWHVYFAQNLDALRPGSGFTQTTAGPINHYGGVCEGGISCTGNRDLYDDFGIAASPTTGLATIIYSDDQYRATQPHSPSCTAATTNSGSCDHTAIATQLSGARIYR